VIGEANFSDHGANRLGASALMQGLADGYFVLPYTIGDYLSRHMGEEPLATDHGAFREVESEVAGRIDRLLSVNGSQTVDFFHRELGRICWDLCGMSRESGGLLEALERIPELRERYWREVRVAGSGEELNQSLEKAGRVADFMELAELMCRDALEREESCGAHLRLEHQTKEGEAMRNDEDFAYVAAWEFAGDGATARMHKEELEFENVPLSQRSYK
jgi:succinate dehydrogenase / fumarate reductase flavoprotein subunit